MFSNIFLQFENLTWIFSQPGSKCPVHYFNKVMANAMVFLPAELLALMFVTLAFTVKKVYTTVTRRTSGYFIATSYKVSFGTKTYNVVTSSVRTLPRTNGQLQTLFSTTQLLAMETSRFILRALVKNKVPLNVAIYFVMPLGTILWVVLLANNLGMLPFAFALTSQLSAALTCSALIYFTSLLLSAQLRGYSLVNAFLPAGTPTALYPVLIVIEIVSHASRFISLGVRLAANILAGHLLVKVFAMGVNYVMLCMTAQHPNRLHHHNVIRRYSTELNWLHMDAQRYQLNAKTATWMASPRYHGLVRMLNVYTRQGYYPGSPTCNLVNIFKTNRNLCERHSQQKLTQQFSGRTLQYFSMPMNPTPFTRLLCIKAPHLEASLLPRHSHTLERQGEPGYHYDGVSAWHSAARYKPFTSSQRFRSRSAITARAKQLTTVRNEWHVMISSASLLVIGLGFLLPIIIMETAVASLQAYVFFHLSSMYISEAITAKH